MHVEKHAENCEAIPVQLYMTTFNYVQLPKNKLTMYSRREEVKNF